MDETYYVYYSCKGENDSDYEGFGSLEKAIEVANQWVEEIQKECEVGIVHIVDGSDKDDDWSLWDNLKPMIVLPKREVTGGLPPALPPYYRASAHVLQMRTGSDWADIGTFRGPEMAEYVASCLNHMADEVCGGPRINPPDGMY